MPADMQRCISVPYVPPYDQFRPPNPAEGQRKSKVHFFLPSFVDRTIFRTKPTVRRDTTESHLEVDCATNVDSPATKSHVLRRLKAQLDCTEMQKSRTANRGLRTSLVAVNKERKAAQTLDEAQRHSRAVQEQLKLDHKAMQSEVSEIIQSYDSKLRDMNELNMRQGAQVIKLQSMLFDRDERIAHLESFEVSSLVVETAARETSARNLESALQADAGSKGRVVEVQTTSGHQSKPQPTEPAVVVKGNSVTKHEPERRGKLVKRHRSIAHNASERRNDDPFASKPNLAPHRRIRTVLADARDRTLATISELKDVRRKKDKQQPSQACHGHQVAFQDIRGLLADAQECGARTQATVSDMKDVRRKEGVQCPSQACHGHQAEFAAYQDQIAALTSERDMLSRELKRSTRMASSNAFLLNSVELQAQRLLSEHDALIVEHQQERARSQQQIRELETQLEETAATASQRCKAEREQLLEVEEQLKLERIQSAQNHGDHLDEMLVLFRENAEQANLIETLNREFAEQLTTLQKVHIQLDLANKAQATLKRKLQKMEIASQQAQGNVELLHSTPPKAQGSIFRNLSKRLSRNGPRQVLYQGSPLVTEEIVKNEKARPPVAATGAFSSLPTSAHKVESVTSQHPRRMFPYPPEHPSIAEPSPRDPPNDTLNVSTLSIFSKGGGDLLLEPSKDVMGEGNGLAPFYSMLSVVRMYAPSSIRSPPEIQPRRRNLDPFKITVHLDDMAKMDGVAVR